MTDTDLGATLPLPVPSSEMQHRLATRRSAPAQSLAGPGPSRDEIERILALGARTPDHGKLFPWRFVVMGPKYRAELAADLSLLVQRQPDPDKAAKVLSKLTAAPLTILVVSTPTAGHKVPKWEQRLSAVDEDERVAGFIHIGTISEPPLERPRPDLSVRTDWRD
jgi:nitroreductase